MICSFCAQGITKAFETEKSVKKVKVNLEEKSVNIKLKRFRRLSDKKIRSIIKDAGYTLNEIKR
jgi:mercuric ion binding protein